MGFNAFDYILSQLRIEGKVINQLDLMNCLENLIPISAEPPINEQKLISVQSGG